MIFQTQPLGIHFSLLRKIGVFGAKMFLGGLISYGLNIGLTFLLVELFTLPAVLSFTITQSIIIIYSFVYNSLIIFRDTMTGAKFMKYIGVVVIISAINITSVRFLTETLAVFYIISITITITITIFLKYALYWFFVFDRKPHFTKHTSSNIDANDTVDSR